MKKIITLLVIIVFTVSAGNAQFKTSLKDLKNKTTDKVKEQTEKTTDKVEKTDKTKKELSKLILGVPFL